MHPYKFQYHLRSTYLHNPCKIIACPPSPSSIIDCMRNRDPKRTNFSLSLKERLQTKEISVLSFHSIRSYPNSHHSTNHPSRHFVYQIVPEALNESCANNKLGSAASPPLNPTRQSDTIPVFCALYFPPVLRTIPRTDYSVLSANSVPCVNEPNIQSTLCSLSPLTISPAGCLNSPRTYRLLLHLREETEHPSPIQYEPSCCTTIVIDFTSC